MSSMLSGASFGVMGAVAMIFGCISNPAVMVLRGAGILDTSVPISVDMTSQVAIVTGANTGIGLETARALARNGATVILACRSMERGEKAKRDIESHLAECSLDSRGKKENVYADKGRVLVRQLDLSDLDSVRAFARGVLGEFKTLDVLVNNGGIAPINIAAGAVTKQGMGLIFGTNFVGHFLLTKLLLDRMKEAPSARIVNLASVMHRWSHDVVRSAHAVGTDGQFGYNDSKLAMILFARELNRRLKGTSVTAVAVNPGAVASDIWRRLGDTPVVGGILVGVWKLIMKVFFLDVVQGSMPSVYAATQNLKSLVKAGSDYFAPYYVLSGLGIPLEMMGPFAGVRPVHPALPAQEEHVSAELWRVCEGLVAN